MVDTRRVRFLKEGPERKGPVIYCMSRDQRAQDNWALLFAQELARDRKEPLGVLFCLVPKFLNATMRQYDFMLRGLAEVEGQLGKKAIPFFLLRGSPGEEIPRFVAEQKASLLVTDFDPLRVKLEWKRAVAARLKVPMYEVDAHNIVPCWVASAKQEVGARTFRPKIHRLLGEFMQTLPGLRKHPYAWPKNHPATDWQEVQRRIRADNVPPLRWLESGEKAARQTLDQFIRNRLPDHVEGRNDPSREALSNLSPYLHFGQISAQRVAFEVSRAKAPSDSKDAFLEELIVRRELADNFCYYNADYDRVAGFPGWAKKTLGEHEKDKRPYLYTLEQFERAETHDELWNAAQMEMVRRGKMHGYMRMYWGKKILEWTRSAEEAMEVATLLNDRYELDGRDPNGYTGIAWSIGGVHDRPWGGRPVFGNIRYMSYNGCRSKFDVNAYVDLVRKMEGARHEYKGN
jgi:deoxyribodipyrimidine photo-lyase